MLELKNIKKIYPAGGDNVEALKGISIRFRNSEFVSILGPSGCGKTTMLNIIGGLDQYTAGELVINGTSTKDYKDRDWDTYRNHSVGFVFQSYNLIPHQTVLQNVELSLTLSGIGKAERRRRAKEALEKVGLGNQLKKLPGEMSGGQMQRVAIARAIVNNPDIVLADEPTGALDSETSIRVMEILKEISKDRLVIMVTHNPELAQKYSTRIVKMLDGRLLSDTSPLTDEEAEAALQSEEMHEAKQRRGKKKPSMSPATSFGLSLKNLVTKKGRTVLTSFAGSIGIIGIALIYAVSEGTTAFIDSVQEETLSSYPLTIEATHIDANSLLSAFMGNEAAEHEHEKDAVYQKTVIYEMLNYMNSSGAQQNDLKAFRSYIESERENGEGKLSAALSGVQYTYDTEMLIYTENIEGDIIRSDLRTLLNELMADYMGIDVSPMTAARSQSLTGNGTSLVNSSSLWRELVPGKNGKLVNEVTENQYELIYGSWPSRYDELVLFVDRNNELNDMVLYALGLKSKDEISALLRASADHGAVEYEERKWSYEDICNLNFRTILNSDCYIRDETDGTYSDLRNTSAGIRYLYDNGTDLHVTGIVKPREDAISANVNGAIGYTYKLTEYITASSESSQAVQAQKNDPSTDIFTGLPFRNGGNSVSDTEKAARFREYIAGLGTEEKAGAYIRVKSVPDPSLVEETVRQTMASVPYADRVSVLTEAMAQQTGIAEEQLAEYFSSMGEAEINALFASMIEEQFKIRYSAEVASQLEGHSSNELSAALEAEAALYTDEMCASLYDEVLDFSDSDLESNLRRLGCVDLESPASVNLYAASFADKDVIEAAISDYNEAADESRKISYTDYVGIMMSSVTAIIDAVTYGLIAFVAVSLIVSSIMIGVITLISVQERTKEIGILRAIGASKRNVSGMFNAETVIMGFSSGVTGVLLTYLLCIPVNLIMHTLTGFSSFRAFLPPLAAVFLILLSTLLTLIAGIIPSRSAAKKDPVVALRTE